MKIYENNSKIGVKIDWINKISDGDEIEEKYASNGINFNENTNSWFLCITLLYGTIDDNARVAWTGGHRVEPRER